MRVSLFQVDAFTEQLFKGNPAAVCPLDNWLDDDLLQAIAGENNLSETAFFVRSGDAFELRWFTPLKEVNLCGHATLAAAHIIFEKLAYPKSQIDFQTKSGRLSVEKNAARLTMDFPALFPKPCPVPEALLQGLGQQPLEVLASDDYLVLLEDEDAVRAVNPNLEFLKQLDLRGVIVTAPGQHANFVSRFFAPKYGIPEDPVTGSAHCILSPYWAGKLNKTMFSAEQLSKRGGKLICELKQDRVFLTGHAVTYMEASISLDI